MKSAARSRSTSPMTVPTLLRSAARVRLHEHDAPAGMPAIEGGGERLRRVRRFDSEAESRSRRGGLLPGLCRMSVAVTEVAAFDRELAGMRRPPTEGQDRSGPGRVETQHEPVRHDGV